MSCSSGFGSFFVIASGVIASSGCAQHRVANSFAELQPRLKVGQTLYLTVAGGEVRKGTLDAFSAEGAQVRIAGATTQFSERDTVQIAVPEPLWQGAVIGAASGAALGASAQLVGQAHECFFGSAGACGSRTPVAGLVMGAGLGTAIGIGIDALVWKRTTVFTAAGAAHRRIVVSPTARRRSAGIQLTAVF